MDYRAKRSFDETPEPEPKVAGDVDPTTAPAGPSFVIHQHHARRLHFDLRLEMKNGNVPVLVSWAVPKNLPREKGGRALAVHVEDHPFEYGSFSGSIPAGNYGAGDVRIFDSGSYEMVKRESAKLTFRLEGRRMKGLWHLVKTSRGKDGKDDWLVILSEWHGDTPEPLPSLLPMVAKPGKVPLESKDWAFEPAWKGLRVLAVCGTATKMVGIDGNKDLAPAGSKLDKLHDRMVALDAVVDGVIVKGAGQPAFVAFDLLYLDGVSLVQRPFDERRELLDQTVVPAEFLQVTPSLPGQGEALMNAAAAQGLAGIIAKKRSSAYEPGNDSGNWLKLKTTI